MLNNVNIAGRITKDIELRQTGSGTSVCSFSIACERDFKNQSGEKETDFIDVIAWRNTADFISRFFAKGRMIIIDGRLQTRNWEDKHGNKRKAVEIVAENVYFGDSKRQEDTYDSAPAVEYEQDVDDGSLPF